MNVANSPAVIFIDAKTTKIKLLIFPSLILCSVHKRLLVLGFLYLTYGERQTQQGGVSRSPAGAWPASGLSRRWSHRSQFLT